MLSHFIDFFTQLFTIFESAQLRLFSLIYKRMNPEKIKKSGKGHFLLSFIWLFILVFTGFYSLVSFAQDDTEQLELKLQQLPDDTARVNVLLKLGEQNCSFDNDKALMYLQEAYSVSLATDYTKGIGKSLLWMGRVFYYK